MHYWYKRIWIELVRDTAANLLRWPYAASQSQLRSTPSYSAMDAVWSENPVWGHVMATGACPVYWCSRSAGHQVAASGLGVFLEHTVPVALQAWLAEHLSAMCGPTDWADPQPEQSAKWTSYTHGCPSGICGLMSLLSQSHYSLLARIAFPKLLSLLQQFSR